MAGFLDGSTGCEMTTPRTRKELGEPFCRVETRHTDSEASTGEIVSNKKHPRIQSRYQAGSVRQKGSTNSPPRVPAVATTRSVRVRGSWLAFLSFRDLCRTGLRSSRSRSIDPLASYDTCVASVVFDKSGAVATNLWLQAKPGKMPRFTFCVIEQRVVSRVKVSATHKAIFHSDCNPMAELE